MNPQQKTTPTASWYKPRTQDLINNGLVAVLIGLLYFLYRYHGVSDVGYFFKDSTSSLFKWLRDRWFVDYHYAKFAFSHWVPLICLLLVWRDRHALRVLPRRTSLAGLVVVVAGFALHWAGLKSEQTRLSILSMVVLSWGFPFFICGWPTARRLIFPCGFLLFSIPLNFFDSLAQPIRIVSAAVSSGLLTGLGIETVRSGPYITSTRIDGLRVNLGDPAGGIFAIIAIVAYALLCAYLMRSRWKSRIAVLAASVPLLMMANIFRAVLAMLAGVVLSADAGEYIQTKLSAWIAFVLAFGGVTALAVYLHRRAGIPAQPNVPHPMEGRTSPVPSLLTAIAIAGLAAWWIPNHSTVYHKEEAGVNLDLPSSIDDWKGGVILFCHNPERPEELFTHDLKPGDPCPTCGQPLQELAAYEKKLLPPDTQVRKNWYKRGANESVVLSIVLSGKNRSSIHRPEVCLVGDGSQISRSFTHGIALADGRILKVKVLEMVHQFKDRQGHIRSGTSYYAYWFAGIGRETPDHVQRMIWMASDRLFKSQSYRWAYLSLGGARTEGRTDYLVELDAFIRLAYPYLIRK